ncbi:MAG: protein kinase [Pirellula sp.]
MSGEDESKLDTAKGLDADRTNKEPTAQDFQTLIHSSREQVEEKVQDAPNTDEFATQYLGKSPDSDDKNDDKSLPTDIPGFVIERELGRGAFGVVYCARDEMLHRKVAIKKPLFSNPAHRQQYIDEARKAVKLDHPMIVPIYQVGVTGSGEPFVVQKLIEGANLRQLLSDGNRLPLSRTISIMRQVCMAVDAAHAAGIVHRDLKPENLLVEGDGRVFVADFGLAILEDESSQKRGREVAGTPHYMSPEQFVGRLEWLDGRSDIWALGVILYELLSGRPPFSGKNLAELKDQIKNKDPRPLSQRDPKIPNDFDLVFRKCCAKNVADRYSSARELMAALDTIEGTLPFLETATFDSVSRSGVFNANSALTARSAESTQGNLASGLRTHPNAQSTIRGSMASTQFQTTKRRWMTAVFIGVPLLALATMGVLWMNPGFLSSKSKEPQADSSVAGLDELKKDAVPSLSLPSEDRQNFRGHTETNAEPKLVAPTKPFSVSVGGKGTHTSIAKAILDSDAGDSIIVQGGVYRESITIDRSIRLIGEGGVSIIGTDNSCLTIQTGSQVYIEGMTLESQAAKRNTVDIENGGLKLVRCTVFASSQESYNCVKARAGTALDAEECKFQSTVHANVSGEKAASVSIRGSSFSFSGTNTVEVKRAGIQCIGASGVVDGCSFIGPCSAGIDWMDASEESISIRSCRFQNCVVGVQINACGNEQNPVSIKGSSEEPFVIEKATWGVSSKQSYVDMVDIRVDGAGDENPDRRQVGLQITEDSQVTLSNCTVRRTACGILVKQSKLKLENMMVQDTSFVGMLNDGGMVEGDELNLLNSSAYGLVVISRGAQMRLKSLNVTAVPPKRGSIRISPAVYMASGRVEIENGQFKNCLCAFTIDPSREIINSTGLPERRTLIEIIGDPKLVLRTQSPVEIESGSITLTDCDMTWLFNGPGTSRIKQIQASDSVDREPRLTQPELVRTGADLFDFSVVEKKN